MTMPEYGARAFHCPHCGAFAHQEWRELVHGTGAGYTLLKDDHDNVDTSLCHSCRRPSLWVGQRLVYPRALTAPSANPDMPDDVARDYEEARKIADHSPRGAAALLRLAMEKLAYQLCQRYNEAPRNLNDAIGTLVQQGLQRRMQEALDTVRVIGNEAVHPGSLDLNDDRGTAAALFDLVNIIVERMITEERHIDVVYSRLPTNKREGIQQRDSKKDTQK